MLFSLGNTLQPPAGKENWDSKIAWCENRVGKSGADGPGFSEKQVITTEVGAAPLLTASDLDGDGDSDVLLAEEGKVAWYENQNGESGAGGGNGFGEQQVITTKMEEVELVTASDLNGDDDIDVLAASNNKVAWYENQVGESGTNGRFGRQQLVTTHVEYLRSVTASDLDGDGDEDLLFADWGDDKIAWYENRVGGGHGNVFGNPQEITPRTDVPAAAESADLDGDGDEDVFAAFKGNVIAWYENQIGKREADGDGFGEKQVITTKVDNPQSVTASDLDGDGDKDVLSASTEDDKIAWYENRMGKSGTDDGFGRQQVISTEVYEPESVTVSDLDGDGDEDVLSSSSRKDKIAWYENRNGESGTDEDGFGTQQVVTTKGEIQAVAASDLDGDGDVDVLTVSEVLTASEDKVAWHENRIGESGTDDGFGRQQVISTEVYDPESVVTSDLDGDGNEDVLSASSTEIAWYENRVGSNGAGGEGFGEQRVITTDAEDAHMVTTSDLDGDRDEDVLSVFWYDEEIAWHENQIEESGTDDGFAKPRVITTGVENPSLIAASYRLSMSLSDLDGDGDEDVLTADGETVAWHENRSIKTVAVAVRGVLSKATAAYEDDRNERTIEYLERVEELLGGWDAPSADSLRARRLALLSQAQYQRGELGGAQRALLKMEATGAVPQGLVKETTDHRRRVETALMEALPKAVRESIRTAATIDTLNLSEVESRRDDANHRLNALPDSIGRVAPRRSVDLSGNDLSSLPESIWQWTEVRELDLSHNRFGSVPKSIAQLSNLRELDLSGNRLTELPASIGRLNNLRRLDLSENALSGLPDGIDQLSNLRRLDLSGTKLDSLSPRIEQLTSLRRLDISHNGLTEIPVRIGQLTRLRRLDLSSNDLSGLPNGIDQLPNLRRLDLSRTELDSLPSRIGQLTSLRRLDVSNNGLTEIPARVGRLTNLRRLDLSGNYLTDLLSPISRLSNLRRLDLSYNNLSGVPSSIGQLTRLRRLDLSLNNLSALPSSIDQLTGLRRLDVSNNGPTELGNLNVSDSTTVVRRDSSGYSQSWRSDFSGNPRWMETAQVLIPIEEERHPARVFLDTLTQVVSRTDSVMVMRSPAHPEEQSLEALRDRLINTAGIDLSSATHARVDYQFLIADGEFEERIRGIQFLYRPGPDQKTFPPLQEAVPLLFVNGQNPWVQDVLRNKSPSTIHQMHHGASPFKGVLRFARMAQDGHIIRIAGRPVWEGFAGKKRRLIQKIQRLTYQSN